MREQITSRKNSLIVDLRKLLGHRSARRDQGLLVGDGLKLLEEAAKWSDGLETVVTTAGVELPSMDDHVRIVEVPEDIMRSVSNMQTPQGALFLCRIPEQTVPECLQGKRYLILDGMQDPGNVGTIWRTADALGADGLILVNGCADPWNPKTVRATMGACFRLPVYELEADQLLPLMERSGIPMYATALREDTIDIREANLECAGVIIGNEGRGVSQELLRFSEKTLKIPMVPRCESLNAAAASAVVLWEMMRSGT